MNGTELSGGVEYSHIWILDGYKKYLYAHYRMIKIGDSGEWQIDEVIETSTTYLYHYNWGYYGDCNGYYSSGVFDSQLCIQADSTTSRTFNYNYNVQALTVYH